MSQPNHILEPYRYQRINYQLDGMNLPEKNSIGKFSAGWVLLGRFFLCGFEGKKFLGTNFLMLESPKVTLKREENSYFFAVYAGIAVGNPSCVYFLRLSRKISSVTEKIAYCTSEIKKDILWNVCMQSTIFLTLHKTYILFIMLKLFVDIGQKTATVLPVLSLISSFIFIQVQNMQITEHNLFNCNLRTVHIHRQRLHLLQSLYQIHIKHLTD